MKNRIITLLTLLVLGTLSGFAAERPRLVVNIVVSGMTNADLVRYEKGFGEGGFRRLLGGEFYSQAYYSFAPTTPSALATLTTGALPSEHGVVGSAWWNQNTRRRVGVVEDAGYCTYGNDSDQARVSNVNLQFETLGDVVVGSYEGARSVTVATDAESAIILGGTAPSEVWWIDDLGATWTTSTKYAASLPKWVNNYNRTAPWRKRLGQPWVLSKGGDKYINEEMVVAKPHGYKLTSEEKSRGVRSSDLRELKYSYLCNDVVAEFAKEAIVYNRLGGDDKVDVLNICFLSPRKIASRYGLHSREMEDMYYRLDEALADFVKFASAQASGKILFVLTTDGGSGEVVESERIYNATQAQFLVNSFLSATYGKGDWVLGSEGTNLWLNHTQIFSKGLDLATVQRQAAVFALQFRGVSHAITASELTLGGYNEGVKAALQDGFYPKYSPDLMLVLMPGWGVAYTEDEEPKITSSQAYALHRRSFVALSGWGVEDGRKVTERVDIRSVVVTLADKLAVESPMGADCEPLP